MVNVNKLRGIMAEKQVTGEKLAQEIGITPKTFYSKMKTGNFGIDEVNKIIEVLEIENPIPVFFAPSV